MTPKPTDQDRFTFLKQFQCCLAYDHETKMWHVRVGNRMALGKDPRKAIDEAIKWTRDRSKP